MIQLSIFSPAEKQIERLERKQKAEAEQKDAISWSAPPTLDEMIDGKKRMAEKTMNTDIWPERPELYSRPREKYIFLLDGEKPSETLSGKRKPNPSIRLGPFHTDMLNWLPLEDRKQVLDVMIQHPWHFINWESGSGEAEKPRRKLNPEVLEVVRKRRIMKRILKKFGMFADEMIKQEYEATGRDWADADDVIWAEEKKKFAEPKKKKAKRKKKGRSKDNDEFETKATA